MYRSIWNGVVAALIVVLCAPALATAQVATPSAPPVDDACNAPRDAHIDGPVYAVPRHHCNVQPYTISVFEEGRFRKAYGPRIERPAAEIVDPVIDRLRKQAATLAPGETLKILIHAHGGLVSHEAAIKNAESLSRAMINDGFAPIFLVWNSGLFDAYPNRLCCVRDGEHDGSNAVLNSVSRLGGDVAASIVRSPQNFGGQLLRFNESVIQQQGEKYYLQLDEDLPQNGLCAALNAQSCPHLVFPPATGTDPREREAMLNGRGRSVKRELAYTVLLPARAITTVLLPEVGVKAWDNMVRRTRMSFTRSSVPAPLASADCVTIADVPAMRGSKAQPHQGGFAVFFDRLSCELETRSGKIYLRGTDHKVEIHFYGHSMGSFVGNEALRLYPDLPWKSLTFMAAAASNREFLVGAAPTLARHPDIRFANLTLHPLNESRELFAGGVAPQGSLLEWVDEMFEGPRSPDERTMGKWSNFKRNAHLIPASVRAQTTVRVFAKSLTPGAECGEAPAALKVGAAGDAPKVLKEGAAVAPGRCHPVSHGEFDDFSFWRTAYAQGPTS